MVLSTFQGGFEREAAAQVAGASLLMLGQLIEKSLLRPTSSGRYHIHELLRQFVETQLEQDPVEAAAARQAHSTYYLNLLQQYCAALIDNNAPAALRVLVDELENVRSSWWWAVTQRDWAALQPIATGFWRIYWIQGRVQEYVELITEAFLHFEQTPASDELPEADIIIQQFRAHRAMCYYFQGRYIEAQREFQLCMDAGRRLGVKKMVADALVVSGAITALQGKLPTAEQQLNESLALFQELHDGHGIADALHELSRLKLYAGDYVAAQRMASESLTLSRRLQRQDWIAYALLSMGWAAFCQGEYTTAQQHLGEGLALFEAIDHKLGIALILGGLGMLALAHERDYQRAQLLVEQSLTICREVGHRLQVAHRLSLLAMIANQQGNTNRAQSYAQEGRILAHEVRNPNIEAQNLCCLAEALYVEGDLATSRQSLITALEIAAPAGLAPRVIMALFHYAILLSKENERDGGISPDAEQRQAQALWLSRIVASHPASWRLFRDAANSYITQIEAILPPEIALEAKTRPLDWQMAVAALLSKPGTG